MVKKKPEKVKNVFKESLWESSEIVDSLQDSSERIDSDFEQSLIVSKIT